MTYIAMTSLSPKFDLPELSFILHYRKDSEDRENNLRTTLKFLRENFTSDIIVIWDDVERNWYTDTLNWISFYAKVKLLNNPDDFKKSESFNGGASFTEKKILCFWDVDVLISPGYIKIAYARILNNYEDHVYPFNGTFIDVQKSKFHLLENWDFAFENFERNWSSDVENYHFASGESPGGCTMISREAFERMGGYDERFIGWGFEDTDFLYRSRKVNRVGRVMMDDAICWHMHHDQAIRLENPHYQRNLQIFNENCSKV